MSHSAKRDVHPRPFSDDGDNSSRSKKRRHHGSKHQHKVRNKDSDTAEEPNSVNIPPTEESGRSDRQGARKADDSRHHYRKYKERTQNQHELRHNRNEEHRDLRGFSKSQDKEESSHSRENLRVGGGRDFQYDPQRHIKQEPPDDFAQQRQLNEEHRVEARQQRNRGRTHSSLGDSSANAVQGVEKEQPNFELSGKLTEDTNIYRGVVIKYNEPPEARKPKRRWRLYPFKGDTALPMLPVHRQSAYLLGRDRRIADIPIDHPSCSKQHAVLQYRLTEYHRPDGTLGRKVRPYVIDLGSANGTFINNKQVEAQRYVELIERDVIKFGFSSREYVLLHENVDTSEVTHEDDPGSN